MISTSSAGLNSSFCLTHVLNVCIPSSTIDFVHFSPSAYFILSYSCAQCLHSLSLIIDFILLSRFKFFILYHFCAQCLHSLSLITLISSSSVSLNCSICLIFLLNIYCTFSFINFWFHPPQSVWILRFVSLMCSLSAFSFLKYWFHPPQPV